GRGTRPDGRWRVERAGPRTRGSAAASRGGWFAAFAVSVSVVAALAAVATFVMSSWHPRLVDIAAGLALASAFVIARKASIYVDIRKHALRITIIEIPLVVGLLVAHVAIVFI